MAENWQRTRNAAAVSEVEPWARRVQAAFPWTPILDTFDRPNEGPPPSANWQNLVSGLAVVGNQAAGTNGVDNAALWQAASFGPVVEVYFTIPVKIPDGSSGWCGWVRAGTLNGFIVLMNPVAGTDTMTLLRLDAGVPTAVGAAISLEMPAGSRIGLRSAAGVHSIYADVGAGWALAATRSDATYSGQTDYRIGMDTANVTSRYDNFGGGTPVAGTGLVEQWAWQTNVAGGTEPWQKQFTATAGEPWQRRNIL